MSDPLREKLIRLAHAQPELRDDLLPLLKQAGTFRYEGSGVLDMAYAVSDLLSAIQRQTDFPKSARSQLVKAKSEARKLDEAIVKVVGRDWDAKAAGTTKTAGIHYWARIEDIQKEYLQQTTDTLIRLLGPGWDGQQLRRGALVRRTTGEPVYFNLDFYHPDGRAKPEIRVQSARTSGVPDFGAVVDSSDQSAKEIAKQLKKAL